VLLDEDVEVVVCFVVVVGFFVLVAFLGLPPIAPGIACKPRCTLGGQLSQRCLLTRASADAASEGAVLAVGHGGIVKEIASQPLNTLSPSDQRPESESYYSPFICTTGVGRVYCDRRLVAGTIVGQRVRHEQEQQGQHDRTSSGRLCSSSLLMDTTWLGVRSLMYL
jgi:hypothetical protein